MTDYINHIAGSVKFDEFSADIAYSRKLGDHSSTAIAFRLIRSNLEAQSVSLDTLNFQTGLAFSADVAAYYQKPLYLGNLPTLFAAGVNISNVGNKLLYSDEIMPNFLPTNLRIGPYLAVDLGYYQKLTVMIDFNKLLIPIPPLFARENGSLVIGPDGKYIIEEGKDPNRSVLSGIIHSFSDAPGGLLEELNEHRFSRYYLTVLPAILPITPGA